MEKKGKSKKSLTSRSPDDMNLQRGQMGFAGAPFPALEAATESA
jgi:hypothetical protein